MKLTQLRLSYPVKIVMHGTVADLPISKLETVGASGVFPGNQKQDILAADIIHGTHLPIATFSRLQAGKFVGTFNSFFQD